MCFAWATTAAKGGRHLQRLGPFTGKVQPDPEIGVERLRECRWEPAVDACHPDRLAQRRLRRQAHGRAGGVPELRHLHRPRRPCLRLPVSVHRHHLVGVQPLAEPVVALRRRDEGVVHRPEDPRELGPALRQVLPGGRQPAVAGSGSFMLWEFPLAFWMEKEGYDVSYISNVDTHADGAGLRGRRVSCRSGTTNTGRWRCTTTSRRRSGLA